LREKYADEEDQQALISVAHVPTAVEIAGASR